MNARTSAKIIAHSKAPNGEELITMEVEFHRFILPEVNTHRVLTRNYQSSRAVPIVKMLEQVNDDPAMPVFWGQNKPGMIADDELPDYKKETCKLIWREAAKNAVTSAKLLEAQGCHKQITNRLLEPFVWTKGVITATLEHFKSFFKLRSHFAAQPEIQCLSHRMEEAIKWSEPHELKNGEYHLPYVSVIKIIETGEIIYLSGDEVLTLEQAIKVSVSCCAQVSYRNLDTSVEKAERIYDMLNLPVEGKYPNDPPHFSPAEHVAKCIWEDGMGLRGVVNSYYRAGNFRSQAFFQYRKALERGDEKEFLNGIKS